VRVGGWSADERASIATIHAALDRGVIRLDAGEFSVPGTTRPSSVARFEIAATGPCSR
jgi:hypothetical protein